MPPAFLFSSLFKYLLMNPCLQNIVLLSDACGESTSGYYLLKAPEISIEALAAVANSTHQTARKLAEERIKLAAQMVANDLIAALHANRIATNQSIITYDSSEHKGGTNMGFAPVERGVTIIRNAKGRGLLRKLKLTEVQVYPLQDAEAVTMKVYDENSGDYEAASYTVALVANQVNTFKLDYTVKGKWARVVFDNTALSFASAPVKCGEGCNGILPNDCAYARGWNGYNDIRKGDGYGVNVRFQCYCDYEQLLCNLSKTYVGEIIWLKARVLLMEDHLRTDRFNNWVVYGKKETDAYRQEVENEYRERWNTLMGALPNILRTYNDDCIECRGARWVTNI